MKKTVNYNLNKPEYTDFADVVNDNQNMDTLDQLIFLLNQDKVDKVVGKGLSANDLTDLLKAKIDGIATGANNYTHPASHSASIINETATRKFVSSDEKIAWNAKWNFNEGEIKTIKVNSALNADTVNGKTVAVSVPANAKFTDTIATKTSIGLGNVDNIKQASKTEFDAHVGRGIKDGETHGIRITEGKFEFFDGLEWQKVKGDGYPVGNITDFATKGDNTTIDLTWIDPPNVTIKDSLDNIITIARWKGTKILRKTNSYPQNENDGVLVVDSGVRDQYKTVGFTDTGLVNERKYFYMAFPYTEEDVFTVDPINRVTGTPSDVDDKTGSPGSLNLIAGDMTAGYFGVVPASELYTGSEISTATGISQGTLQFSDVGWLKFAIDGEIIFKSQKTYRHSISWDHINGVGAVKGTKQVSKGGINYKVTLMEGGNGNAGDVAAGPKGSEWNKLMLPIHIKAKDQSWAYAANVTTPTEYWGIDFTDTDLQTISSAGNGSYHWCQEVYYDDAANRVFRGINGVSYSDYTTSSYASTNGGWSPVLRVIA